MLAIKRAVNPKRMLVVTTDLDDHTRNNSALPWFQRQFEELSNDGIAYHLIDSRGVD